MKFAWWIVLLIALARIVAPPTVHAVEYSPDLGYIAFDGDPTQSPHMVFHLMRPGYTPEVAKEIPTLEVRVRVRQVSPASRDLVPDRKLPPSDSGSYDFAYDFPEEGYYKVTFTLTTSSVSGFLGLSRHEQVWTSTEGLFIDKRAFLKSRLQNLQDFRIRLAVTDQDTIPLGWRIPVTLVPPAELKLTESQITVEWNLPGNHNLETHRLWTPWQPVDTGEVLLQAGVTLKLNGDVVKSVRVQRKVRVVPGLVAGDFTIRPEEGWVDLIVDPFGNLPTDSRLANWTRRKGSALAALDTLGTLQGVWRYAEAMGWDPAKSAYRVALFDLTLAEPPSALSGADASALSTLLAAMGGLDSLRWVLMEGSPKMSLGFDLPLRKFGERLLREEKSAPGGQILEPLSSEPIPPPEVRPYRRRLILLLRRDADFWERSEF